MVTPSPPKRLVVDPERPEATALDVAADIIRADGLVGLPTETFYALATDGLSETAVGRVFRAKGREAKKAIGLLVADAAMVRMVAKRISGPARALMERFWPGPLSLILPGKDSLPAGVLGVRRGVSVRVPDSRATVRVIRRVGGPVTATSANPSGERPPRTADEALRSLGDRLEAILDTGPTTVGLPSTMVDLRGRRPLLLREGAVPWKDVIACFG